jgi:succinyl-CoA synthetase alpha subunit
MIAYGTQVVGGVSPGKGHERSGCSGFQYRVQSCSADKSEYLHHFRSGSFAADCIMEAADAGISLIICITEGIPTKMLSKPTLC